MKSNSDIDDPRVDIPYTAKLEPKRKKLRSDIVLPIVMKSNTETVLPSLAKP
jgi:hypothetical protein